VTNRILDDVVAVVQPRQLEIEATFTPRGGIRSIIRASYP
ncbi:MAG: NADPH-dependent 7-cyano-7-deazaguanine reductase QueF, partial [Planctomycetales bacterium]|nr:NADPH-dependent 7-cyano-7-deazaguanine reductase QueF [Planctomycetales bacterium]